MESEREESVYCSGASPVGTHYGDKSEMQTIRKASRTLNKYEKKKRSRSGRTYREIRRMTEFRKARMRSVINIFVT